MLELTNNANLTLAPGQSVTFNTVLLKTGCGECHRNNSGLVNLNKGCATYDVSFSANIGTVAVGTALMAIRLDGETLNETIMSAPTAAAGDLQTVSRSTFVRTCCRGNDTISVTNIGTAPITVSNPNLRVGRWQ